MSSPKVAVYITLIRSLSAIVQTRTRSAHLHMVQLEPHQILQ